MSEVVTQASQQRSHDMIGRMSFPRQDATLDKRDCSLVRLLTSLVHIWGEEFTDSAFAW